jgi:hypothetical protein
MRILLLSLSLSLIAGCRAPAVSAPKADPAAPDPRDVTRPDRAPPMYRAGSDEAPMAITRNAYGAYAYAPRAPQLGDKLADFELPDVRGGTWALRDARARGPVVLVFYRGFW